MDRKKVLRTTLALLLMLALVVQPLALAAPAAVAEVPNAVAEAVAAAAVASAAPVEEGSGSHRDTKPTCYYLLPMADTHAPVRAARAALGGGIDQLFGATRVAPGTAAVNMTIESVQVLDGGARQARWRGLVGGHTVTEDPVSGNFYTTATDASLTDRRLFTINTVIPGALVTAPATFLTDADIVLTYGGLPFTAWLGGSNFSGTHPALGSGANAFMARPADNLLELVEHVELIDNSDGTFTLVSQVQFNSPYRGYMNNAGVNAPLVTANPTGDPLINEANDAIVQAMGFRALGQAGFPLGLRSVVGLFELEVEVNGTAVGSLPIRLNLYDDYHQWYEIDEWAQALQAEALAGGGYINTRFVDVYSIGTSHLGRPIWNIVVAASQGAADFHLNTTVPLMREDPEEFTRQVEAGTYGHRAVIYFTNIHPDEVTGVDAQLIMIEQLINNTELVHHTINNTGEIFTVWPTWSTVNNRVYRTDESTTEVVMTVDEALANFIFVFCPTNNPDGREGLRRVNAYGFDMNRDGSSQVHPENRYMITEILRWSPIIQLDLHGHVAALLIEPCTGPHNPNYEYDLMQDMMIRLAHQMGRAAISGAYDRYMIPAVHMSEGWDDGGPLYLPVYMSHFGILGFTLEIPHANQDSNDANIAMGWAAANYALANFVEIYSNKAQQMYRGLNNIDARALVDPYFINPDTFTSNPADPAEVVGRPRIYAPTHPQAIGGYLDFFPDWWVIPADDVLQYNLLETYNMIVKLLRQGIQVHTLDAAVTHDGVTWPAGTFVVDMRQAFRGAANTLLGTGYDASMFSDIYAGVLSAHPNARGFAATQLWAEGLFDGQLTPVPAGFSVPITMIPLAAGPYMVIRNMGQDAILVVNDLLRVPADVWTLTETTVDGRIGDFVVATTDLTPAILDGRFIELTPLAAVPATAEQLVRPNVVVLQAGPGAGQGGMHPTRYIVSRLLGFDIIWAQTAAEALTALQTGGGNILVTPLNPGAAVVDYVVENAIPVVAIGAAASAAFEGVFAGDVAGAFNAGPRREGLFRGGFATTSALTAHYDRINVVHQYVARSYTAVPGDTVPLIWSDPGVWSDVFLGGWFFGAANQNNALGRYLAFTGSTLEGAGVTIFGTMITRFAHIQMYHNILGTAIFQHVAGIETGVLWIQPVDDALVAAEEVLDTKNPANYTVASWNNFLDALAAAEAIRERYDNADPTLTQAEIMEAAAALLAAIEALERRPGGGLPGPGYTYEYHAAYMFGKPTGEFRPLANTTRAEVAVILVRTMVEGFEEGTYPEGVTAFATFSDVSPDNWFYFYLAWAYAEGLIEGFPDGTFRPNAPITRQEYAAMVARTIDVLEAGELDFADANAISNWALDYVYTVAEAGWMIGDTNHNFRPAANINRAEVATATNRILGRVASNAELAAANLENPEDAREFPDVAYPAWYFASVVAAANDHQNRVDSDGNIVRMVILVD